jgi:hypothetical protein
MAQQPPAQEAPTPWALWRKDWQRAPVIPSCCLRYVTRHYTCLDPGALHTTRPTLDSKVRNTEPYQCKHEINNISLCFHCTDTYYILWSRIRATRLLPLEQLVEGDLMRGALRPQDHHMQYWIGGAPRCTRSISPSERWRSLWRTWPSC